MARRTGRSTCSFCGKDRDQPQRLIVGPHARYICADNPNVCNEIVPGMGAKVSRPHRNSVSASAVQASVGDDWDMIS
jgi:ATP-dependent protease Clp ATPase subunit